MIRGEYKIGYLQKSRHSFYISETNGKSYDIHQDSLKYLKDLYEGKEVKFIVEVNKSGKAFARIFFVPSELLEILTLGISEKQSAEEIIENIYLSGCELPTHGRADGLYFRW